QNSRLALAVTCRIHGWPWLLYDEATGRATCLAARWFCTGPLARHPRAIGVRTPRRGTGRVDGASSGGAGQAGTAAATVPPGTCGTRTSEGVNATLTGEHLKEPKLPRTRDTSYPPAFPVEPPKRIVHVKVLSYRATKRIACQAGSALRPQPLACGDPHSSVA